MNGAGSASKRRMGAAPPENGSPTPQQLLYGTINYGARSAEESTMDGSDALPSQPESMPLPPMAASDDEEDAVSYLAEAMKQANDDEDSVLLIVTPREDGTEEICQVVSAVDGTPIKVRDIIDTGGGSEGGGSESTPSDVKPNNLACLFTDEKGNSVHHHAGIPIQIMDAVEVDGGIILTPQNINHNVAHVFRQSTDASSANLLPSSVIDSDDDEDETLIYHDGGTVIHQCSTFGDHTIATCQQETELVELTPDAGDIVPTNNEE